MVPAMTTYIPPPGYTAITVPEDHDGRRIHKFLAGHTTCPATMLFKLARKGALRVNQKRIKQDHRVRGGDVITLPGEFCKEAKRASKSKNHGFEMLWEGPTALVVNKPAGVPVHAGTGTRRGVIERIRDVYPDAELAHRIDKETSGALLIALNHPELRYLQRAFRGQDVIRIYRAVVEGRWAGARDVKAPIARTPKTMVVRADGDDAHTRFRRVENRGPNTLVEAELITGRRHQIRVHAAHEGHPIVGDRAYGSRTGAQRMFLHAYQLEFTLRNGEHVAVTAPVREHKDRRS